MPLKFDRNIFFDRVRPLIEVRGVGVLPIQVEGINQILDFVESDPRWDSMDLETAIIVLSYFFGTNVVECTLLMTVGGHRVYVPTFHPVEEMGGTVYLNRKYDTRVDLGNTRAHDGDGARNAGDGYVQNTGGTNARTSGRRLAGTQITYADCTGCDARILAAFTREGGSARTPVTIDGNTFIRQHELLRVPRISYLDAIDGIITGRFTGKKIEDYIDDDGNADYYNARRIINGITAQNRPVALRIAKLCTGFESAFHAAHLDSPPQTPIAPIEESKPLTLVGNATPEAVNPDENDDGNAQNGTPTGAEAFTAYIPNMDSAKSYFSKAIMLLLGSNVGAQYLGLPPEIRYALLGLLFLVVGGFIFALVHFRKEVFKFVTALYTVKAQPDTANFNIAPHQDAK